MESKKKPIVAVVGATASGKTGLAIDLATQCNGEVISADSRQIYRGLDIGTAKATKAEMRGIPHHLIDIVDVDTAYTAHTFVRDAQAVAKDMSTRGKLPIIAGGTFFYLDSLLGRSQMSHVAPNPELRQELEALPLDELVARLTELDPLRASTIDVKNPRRLVRAIEVALAPKQEASPVTPAPYDVFTIGLRVDKEVLRERYRARGESWLTAGFLEEITTVLASGITRKRLQEIGFEYTLGVALLEGVIDKEAFLQQFVEKNWQYAKRQLTWLKRDPDITWLEYPTDTSKVVNMVEEFLCK
jgi:tRNA dimethylallyltransferase